MGGAAALKQMRTITLISHYVQNSTAQNNSTNEALSVIHFMEKKRGSEKSNTFT